MDKQHAIQTKLKEIFRIAERNDNIVELADSDEHIKLFAEACKANGYKLIYDRGLHAYRMFRAVSS